MPTPGLDLGGASTTLGAASVAVSDSSEARTRTARRLPWLDGVPAQIPVSARPAIAGRALTARALRVPATAAREPAVVARVGARVATASMFVTVDTQRWAVREWASIRSSIGFSSRGENLIGQVGSKSDLDSRPSLMLARNGPKYDPTKQKYLQIRLERRFATQPLFRFTLIFRDFLNVLPRERKEAACAGTLPFTHLRVSA